MSETVYTKQQNNYKIKIIKTTQLVANYYTVTLVNLTTGATRVSDGWRGYPEALHVAQSMIDKAN